MKREDIQCTFKEMQFEAQLQIGSILEAIQEINFMTSAIFQYGIKRLQHLDFFFFFQQSSLLLLA